MFYNTLKLNHIILYHIWYLQHDKLPFYIYSRILPVLISTCCIEFNHYKTWIYSITVFYNTLKHNRIILYHIWYLQHDKLPFYIYSRILPVLISTCCIEFNHYKTWIYSITVFYNTLKHNHFILYHIWYLQHDKLPFYIYSRILPVLISACRNKFSHYKTCIYSITVYYNTLKLNHIILYNIWYLQHDKLPFYIYSRILPVLISTCCIEFNYYKMRIYSITVFYNTLKHNRIILYHIWYLQHDKLPFYIYSRILPVLISTCCIEFNHYKTWIYSITVFYNTLNHNRIIMYHILSATWWTNSTIYIPEYSQYWFPRAALNLITKSSKFTLLQCSTTLSNLITSFCIIFDICNMINYRFIYIPEYSQYWFQHAVLNLITTRREFTLLQYSTTLSSIIASFCITFDNYYMMNQQCIYIF